MTGTVRCQPSGTAPTRSSCSRAPLVDTATSSLARAPAAPAPAPSSSEVSSRVGVTLSEYKVLIASTKSILLLLICTNQHCTSGYSRHHPPLHTPQVLRQRLLWRATSTATVSVHWSSSHVTDRPLGHDPVSQRRTQRCGSGGGSRTTPTQNYAIYIQRFSL